MKPFGKRLTAALLVCAMSVGLTACGGNTKTIAIVDGETTIPAGIYVIHQMQALSEARSHDDFDAEQQDIHKNVIEDKDFDLWVTDRAEELVKEYAAIGAMYQEQGLEWTQEEQDSVDYYVDSMWAYYQESYESFGISEDSYRLYVTNQYQYNDLFEARYAEGGTEEVSKEDIETQLNKDYAVVQLLTFSLKDDEGNSLDADQQNEVHEQAQQALEQLEKGAKIEDLRLEQEKEKAENPDELSMDESRYMETIQEGQATASVSADLSTAIFSDAKVGEPTILSDDNAYYVVLRSKATDLESNYDTYYHEVLMTLKEDEFDEIVDNYAADMDIVFQQAALKKLKLDKLL